MDVILKSSPEFDASKLKRPSSTAFAPMITFCANRALEGVTVKAEALTVCVLAVTFEAGVAVMLLPVV